MIVYILTTNSGTVHSVWDSPTEVLDHLRRIKPSHYDPWTWNIVCATVNQWGMPKVDSVGYVADLLGKIPPDSNDYSNLLASWR